MTTTFSELEITADEIPHDGHISELSLMWRAFRSDPLAVLSLVILLIFIFGAIFAPFLTPYAAQGQGDPNILEKFSPPSKAHLLGTD